MSRVILIGFVCLLTGFNIRGLINRLPDKPTSKIVYVTNVEEQHWPQVGDVYAEYVDNRSDQYALTNGFHAEVVIIHRVTAVSNGVTYCAALSLPITNRSEYPFPYNEFGPSSNLIKYRQYRTLVKPDPK